MSSSISLTTMETIFLRGCIFDRIEEANEVIAELDGGDASSLEALDEIYADHGVDLQGMIEFRDHLRSASVSLSKTIEIIEAIKNARPGTTYPLELHEQQAVDLTHHVRFSLRQAREGFDAEVEDMRPSAIPLPSELLESVERKLVDLFVREGWERVPTGEEIEAAMARSRKAREDADITLFDDDEDEF